MSEAVVDIVIKIQKKCFISQKSYLNRSKVTCRRIFPKLISELQAR